jgi:hypothetical protein
MDPVESGLIYITLEPMMVDGRSQERETPFLFSDFSPQFYCLGFEKEI